MLGEAVFYAANRATSTAVEHLSRKAATATRRLNASR